MASLKAIIVTTLVMLVPFVPVTAVVTTNARPGLMRHEGEEESEKVPNVVTAGGEKEVEAQTPTGTCNDWKCINGYFRKANPFKSAQVCKDVKSCNFNCCVADINFDKGRRNEVLTLAAMLAYKNLTKFSNNINFPEMHNKTDYDNDMQDLKDKVAGFFNIARQVLKEKKDEFCPSGDVKYIRTCLSMALCVIEENTLSVNTEAMHTYTLLTKYHAQFSDLVWERMLQDLNRENSGSAPIDSGHYAVNEAECAGLNSFMAEFGASLVETGEKKESESSVRAQAYRVSSVLRAATKTSHDVMDAHTHNSSVDETVAALHAAWSPACELLDCDHTNFYDLVGASHSHSLALIASGASAHHMRVHTRTAARLDTRVQQFLGDHGSDMASRMYMVEGTKTDARMQAYGAALVGSLSKVFKRYPKMHGVDSTLLSLVDRQVMKEYFKTPRDSSLLKALWDDKLVIVPDEQALHAISEGSDAPLLDFEDEEREVSLVETTFDDTKEETLNSAGSILDRTLSRKAFVDAATGLVSEIEAKATKFSEAVIVVANAAMQGIVAFVEFVIALLACLGFGVVQAVGYGKKFLGDEANYYLGVAISIAVPYAAALEDLLMGKVATGVGINLGVMVGLVPGGSVTHPCGLRIGVGIAYGVYCPVKGDPNGCKIEVAVGVAASAIVSVYIPHLRCIMGPKWYLFWIDFQCFESFGIAMKLICCQINLSTGKQSCGDGGDSQNSVKRTKKFDVEDFSAAGGTGGHIKLTGNQGYCLNLHANDHKNGQRIDLWQCTDAASMKWEISGGQIKSMGNPLYCLNLHNNQVASGAIVNLWSCSYSTSQRWTFFNGQIRLWSNQNYCLNLDGYKVSSGEVVNLHQCTSHNSMKWTLPEGYGQQYSGTIRFMQTMHSSTHYCLSSTFYGITLEQCTGHSGQRWMIADGQIRLTESPQFCLKVDLDSSPNQAKVALQACNGHGSQKWTVSHGVITLTANPNYCLNVPNSRAANGQQIDTFKCNGHGSQKWAAPQAGNIKLKSNSRYCVNLANNNVANNGVIDLYTCNSVALSMIWTFDNGQIKLSQNVNYCLTLANMNIGNGGTIVLHKCSGHASQKWIAGKYPQIKLAADPSYCLNLDGHNDANNAVINLWKCNGHDSQRWIKPWEQDVCQDLNWGTHSCHYLAYEWAGGEGCSGTQAHWKHHNTWWMTTSELCCKTCREKAATATLQAQGLVFPACGKFSTRTGCFNSHCKCAGQRCCGADPHLTGVSCSDDQSQYCRACQNCAPEPLPVAR